MKYHPPPANQASIGIEWDVLLGQVNVGLKLLDAYPRGYCLCWLGCSATVKHWTWMAGEGSLSSFIYSIPTYILWGNSSFFALCLSWMTTNHSKSITQPWTTLPPSVAITSYAAVINVIANALSDDNYWPHPWPAAHISCCTEFKDSLLHMNLRVQPNALRWSWERTETNEDEGKQENITRTARFRT